MDALDESLMVPSGWIDSTHAGSEARQRGMRSHARGCWCRCQCHEQSEFSRARRRRDVAMCLSADAVDFWWQDFFFHLKYAFFGGTMLTSAMSSFFMRSIDLNFPLTGWIDSSYVGIWRERIFRSECGLCDVVFLAAHLHIMRSKALTSALLACIYSMHRIHRSST